MNRKTIFFVAVSLAIGLFAWAVGSVSASPYQPQSFYQTPTPGPDGRIVYIVKAGDSCLSIALLSGVEMNTLKEINRLNDECALREGQELVLGFIEQPTAGPGPSPTPTSVVPTSTPMPGNGQICIILYADINGNAMPDASEGAIAGGAVVISNRSGTTNLTGITTSLLDPLCFDNIAEGDYNISVAPPEGFNATTNMNYPLHLAAGDQTTLDFGAQISSKAAAPIEEAGSGNSPLLAILGGLLILGGFGLGIYFWFARRG